MSVDREIFSSAAVQVGQFRCDPFEADFNDSGPTTTFCFVFPREAVRIEQEGRRPFVADPNVVVLYNRRQPYRRDRISDSGDRSDWFALREDVVRDAVRRYDPQAADAPDRPISFARIGSDAAMYREQRQLFVRLAREDADPLAVEGIVIDLFDRLLAAAHRGKLPRREREGEVARRAHEIIAARFREPLTLTDVASAVDTSLYNLCRSFRAAFGIAPHAYRDQLRLRTALEHLDHPSLTELALDLGYSSHSHFTARFRRAFGSAPSALRLAMNPSARGAVSASAVSERRRDRESSAAGLRSR